MYKLDLALYDQQWLICHKTKSNKTKLIYINMGASIYVMVNLLDFQTIVSGFNFHRALYF